MITLAKGNKPKDEPKVAKANNEKGAKRVCRASKLSKHTQAIQRDLERVSEEKSCVNEVARIEGAQRVLTGSGYDVRTTTM